MTDQLSKPSPETAGSHFATPGTGPSYGPQPRMPGSQPYSGPVSPIPQTPKAMSPIPTYPPGSHPGSMQLGPTPRRHSGVVVGAVVAVAILFMVAVVSAAIYVLSPTPAERVADMVRAVSADSSNFKTAEDDVIADSVSQVCSTQKSIGNSRPGAMMWTMVVQGSELHPEAVSREEFVEAINDFCASER